MLTKKRVISFIILFTIVFSFINEISTFYIAIDKAKQISYKNNETIFSSIMKFQSDSVRAMSIMLANDEKVKQGYIQNNPLIIREHLEPFWEKLKNDKLIYEIHFFKPPAESFVNFSNYKSIGKDVSSVRKDIKWVTTSFKSSTHNMMCQSYAGIRATYPILDDKGNILGGLSMGKKLDWIPSSIKELSHNESFLVYMKSSTSSLLKKYYDEFIIDKKIIDDYILANETIQIPIDKFKSIDFNQKIQTFKLNGNNYSLDTFPIYDFENKLLGYICTMNDMDSFYNTFYLNMAKGILLILIVSLLVYFLLSYRIDKIIANIKEILSITNNIKDGNFSILEQYKEHKPKFQTDELKNLEENIITMGLSLQDQIEQKDKIMEQQSKMAMMGEMMDNIAHQWRQPLTVISANASGMKVQKEYGIDDKKTDIESLDNIVAVTEHMASTIDDFRGFLKDNKEFINFNLKDSFEKSKMLLSSILKKKEVIIVETFDEDIIINGISNELTQVFMNIISNAIDELEKHTQKRYIFINFYKNNGYIKISIKDNAGGISEDIKFKIFEQRFTTKEKSGGSGVGLYMSKRIIENSFKGFIEVENEIFKYEDKEYVGAIFTINIPMID